MWPFNSKLKAQLRANEITMGIMEKRIAEQQTRITHLAREKEAYRSELAIYKHVERQKETAATAERENARKRDGFDDINRNKVEAQNEYANMRRKQHHHSVISDQRLMVNNDTPIFSSSCDSGSSSCDSGSSGGGCD